MDHQIFCSASPRWVLLQSLRPVKLQAGRGRCFRGAIRRFRKSPSTCSEVRPLSASDLILPSTESKSGGRDGLALQDPRSEAGPSVGMTRRSLASVVAMTHSLRHSSHFPPLSPGCTATAGRSSFGNSMPPLRLCSSRTSPTVRSGGRGGRRAAPPRTSRSGARRWPSGGWSAV